MRPPSASCVRARTHRGSAALLTGFAGLLRAGAQPRVRALQPGHLPAERPRSLVVLVRDRLPAVDAGTGGRCSEARAVGDTELLEEMMDVGLHGLLGDAELVRDRLRRRTLAASLQDFPLAWPDPHPPPIDR